ncbi:MAG: hypothetical protein KIT16_10870 [Rhodospirillaceae bacterium]|nr:hypothetical protein [Rhodospirillaceae bacterium]
MLVVKDVPRWQLIVLAAALAAAIVAGPLSLVFPADTIIRSAVAGVPLIVLILTIALPECVKASARTVAPARRQATLSSPLSPDAAFEKLRHAAFRRCKQVDSDPARRVLLLSSPMAGWSMGFFHPVFVKPAPDGTGAVIDVGIRPKTIQHEATVRSTHEACVAQIEEALAG